MKSFIDKLWNFDFYSNRNFGVGSVILFFVVMLVAIGYPVVEVLFGIGNAGNFSITKYIEAWQNGNTFSFTHKNFEEVFPHIWLLLASFCVLIRIVFIIDSYFKSKLDLGEEAFNKLFVTGISTFIIGAASGIVILLLMAGFAEVTGLGMKWEGNPISFSVAQISAFVDTNIPSILKIQNYWLALLLVIFFKNLPGYFGHWLSHKSRFFWLVTHRSHHVMEYLYPTATAPAFSFDFLLQLPSALLGIIISKLVYTEPMVMEMVLWSTVGYCFEVFNHSITHYQLCYSNPIIRNCSRLFGDLGVYHLVHHSAKPEDHTVNLGAAPFNFWDRVFGTYRKPYAERPPVGLTNQPTISWNPFRIIYSGIAQLVYEWRMNKNGYIRFKILFGSIWYKPPVTKDFLKLNES